MDFNPFCSLIIHVESGTSTRYGSSIDAFYDVINSRRSKCIYKFIAFSQYSFVEITCSEGNNGSQYGLHAYEKEASELNRVALEISSMVIFL